MANKAQKREELRERRHRRVRKRVSGTPERPRLAVHRSLKNMQGQITDDLSGTVLLGISTLAPELQGGEGGEAKTKTQLSREAGKLLAQRALEAGITRVVFDRGGYLYHGRIAAFADGAREGGLEF